jgi:hypothetical protein
MIETPDKNLDIYGDILSVSFHVKWAFSQDFTQHFNFEKRINSFEI